MVNLTLGVFSLGNAVHYEGSLWLHVWVLILGDDICFPTVQNDLVWMEVNKCIMFTDESTVFTVSTTRLKILVVSTFRKKKNDKIGKCHF